MTARSLEGRSPWSLAWPARLLSLQRFWCNMQSRAPQRDGSDAYRASVSPDQLSPFPVLQYEASSWYTIHQDRYHRKVRRGHGYGHLHLSSMPQQLGVGLGSSPWLPGKPGSRDTPFATGAHWPVQATLVVQVSDKQISLCVCIVCTGLRVVSRPGNNRDDADIHRSMHAQRDADREVHRIQWDRHIITCP